MSRHSKRYLVRIDGVNQDFVIDSTSENYAILKVMAQITGNSDWGTEKIKVSKDITLLSSMWYYASICLIDNQKRINRYVVKPVSIPRY